MDNVLLSSNVSNFSFSSAINTYIKLLRQFIRICLRFDHPYFIVLSISLKKLRGETSLNGALIEFFSDFSYVLPYELSLP